MNQNEESSPPPPSSTAIPEVDLLDDTEAILSRKISQLSNSSPSHHLHNMDDSHSLNPDEFEHDDEDEDDVSIDEEAATQDNLIAERTHQLMTDFRSYINDIQGGTDAAAADTTTTNNNNGDSLEYGEYKDKPCDDNNGSLMRGWDASDNSNSNNTKQRKPYRDDTHSIASTNYYDDIAQTSGYNLSSSTTRGRTVYAHSRKIKKCLIYTIAVCISIGVIIGISHSVHNKRVQNSLPDWEGELAKELEEEEEKKKENNGSSSGNSSGGEGIPQHTEQINHNPQVGEGLEKPPLTGAYYAGDQGLDEYGGMSPEDMLQQSSSSSSSSGITFVKNANMEHPAYQFTASSFAPRWFSRYNGWNGESYDQGLIFCADQMDDDDKSMVPCPYTAYCPLGPTDTPFGGITNNEGGWSPILDVHNDWVMTGSGKDNCRKYSEVHSDPPDWEQVSPGEEDYLQYIMCCKSQLHSDDSSISSSTQSITAATNKPTAQPVVATTSQVKPSTAAQMEEDFSLASEEYSFAETFQPKWYGRSDGWDGQTWPAAYEFCGSKMNRMLCPYEVYCPTGPNHLPYGGVRPESTVWAPISDSSNGWVSVSVSNTCLRYAVLNLVSPSWGMSGVGNEEMTRHVMCCTDPTSIAVTDAEEEVPVAANVDEDADADTDTEAMVDGEANVVESSTNDEGDTNLSNVSLEVNPTPTGEDDPGLNNVSVEVNPTPMSSENEEKLYGMLSKNITPMAFTRELGWDGQTYSAALMFCASKESMIPCPYEVVCPEGNQGQPISGVREGKYTPVIDAPNSWASLETCDLYNDVHLYPPKWGISDVEVNASEETSVLVCCKEDGMRAKRAAESEALDTNRGFLQYAFKPHWFGRSDGYKGGPYEHARIFCQNVAGMDLCPAEVYCPDGNKPMDKPLFPQRAPFESNQWAPFDNGDGDGYLLVGPVDNNPTTVCMSHTQLDGKEAEWGGENTELKQHILCCLESDNMEKETAMLSQLDPKWLHESDGWTGGSYDDAANKCQSIGRSLCPFYAYCPRGPSRPLHAHKQVFYGEQWAPFHEENQWVMIGQKYNNMLTTCMTHRQLEGGDPDWGLTDDNPTAKQHILCCLDLS